MHPSHIKAIINFLCNAEQLKNITRTSWTSDGHQESVAEHTWRLCLMSLIFEKSFPDINFSKLLKICIIHDLGEAINGDIPAPEQDNFAGKSKKERQDLLKVLEPLPDRLKREIISLWDEYEQANTPEAKLAKALDKLETILQHNQGKNPYNFDFSFNLKYGKKYTDEYPLLALVRQILDSETEMRVMERSMSP